MVSRQGGFWRGVPWVFHGFSMGFPWESWFFAGFHGGWMGLHEDFMRFHGDLMKVESFMGLKWAWTKIFDGISSMNHSEQPIDLRTRPEATCVETPRQHFFFRCRKRQLEESSCQARIVQGPTFWSDLVGKTSVVAYQCHKGDHKGAGDAGWLGLSSYGDPFLL